MRMWMVRSGADC